tara:strand:+ start:466 stop:1470 length:1005 start_codon:yes stop_codon:yes gene_type:complete
MILKSFIIEKNISLLEEYENILIYGENDGIKEDLREKIKEKNVDSEIINIFQEEILKNKNLLLKEVKNLSLFNNKKIIFLHEITDKIYKEITECLENKTKETKIYIFSQILEKKSKLRNYFEKDKKFGIVPCYQDNERTLVNYINLKLKDFKGLSPQIINLIISNSSLDRKIINNEIIKIKSFFTKKTIDLKQLQELLNIKFNRDFNEIRDASLLGDKIKVNRLLGEIQFQPEDFIFYLNNITSRVSKLLEIQNINEETKDHEIALDMLKTKVFWKDKPIYIEQLKKWNNKKLENALNKIGKVELLMKKNSQIKNDILIKNLLINVCSQASRSA